MTGPKLHDLRLVTEECWLAEMKLGLEKAQLDIAGMARISGELVWRVRATKEETNRIARRLRAARLGRVSVNQVHPWDD